jgi:phosphoadenosine phosphosulfate reductase
MSDLSSAQFGQDAVVSGRTFFGDCTVGAKPVESADIAARLSKELRALNLFQRLAAIRTHISGRIVFTTGFGLEGQAIAHAVFSQHLAIEVATLDTGRLFPETYEVWAKTEQRYGVRVHALMPERKSLEALLAKQGIDGFRSSVAARHTCCDVRKVAPLGRVLKDAAGWITGVRAEQSAERSQMEFVAVDQTRNLVKANPLFDWTRAAVVKFIAEHEIPYNALHDRGFLSIGCAPCTRAVHPDEPERAGRWCWEQDEKKECGLHLSQDG